MRKISLIILAVFATFALSGLLLALTPSGGTITSVSNATATLGTAGQADAYAGNVSEITVTSFSTTQAWQGYFGNVTGTIRLADGSDNQMYNWTTTSPSGEIYASENSSINWTGTSCFNYTADLATTESRFNISSTDVDGLNETFSLSNHDGFFVNNIEIAADTCNSTRIYGDTNQGVDQEFEEVLLSGGSNELIFASLLESDMLGFDDSSHDFEMLVLENGHGTDTSTTPYYFYLELE